MSIELEIEEQNGPTRKVTVELPATLGRAESCSVQLSDPRVSGRHVELLDAGGRIRIKDLGSRNGIAVEPGQKLQPHGELTIERETVLRIGDSRVVVRPNLPKPAALDLTLEARPPLLRPEPEVGAGEADDIYKTLKRAGPPRFEPKSSDSSERVPSKILKTARRPDLPPAMSAQARGAPGPAAAAAPAPEPPVADPPPRTPPVPEPPPAPRPAAGPSVAPPEPAVQRPAAPAAAAAAADGTPPELRDTTEYVGDVAARGVAALAPSILLATKTMRRVQPMKGARFTFGRSKGADWSFDDKRVSNEHCAIEYSGGAWSIVDLGSANGTFLGEQRLEPRANVTLHPPASFELGEMEFYFFLAAPDECARNLAVQKRALGRLVGRGRITHDEREMLLAQAKSERRDVGELLLREKLAVRASDWMAALRASGRPSKARWIVLAGIVLVAAAGVLLYLRSQGRL